MPIRYLLDINYSRVNREKKGFKFAMKGDIDKKWGCEVRTVSTTSSTYSTMRVARLIVESDRFEFVTKLHCTVTGIVFAANSPIPEANDGHGSSDAYADLPGSITIVTDGDLSGLGLDPEDWWWRLTKLKDKSDSGKIVSEGYKTGNKDQILLLS